MFIMKNLNLERKEINSKGITLVALVVTIIILLVLAGITVASLTGDNGLIGKTGEAKKQTEISEGLEQLEIAVTQSTNKRGNIDETKLAKNLSKINGLKYINTENEEIDITENTEIKLTAKVKLKGNTFKINNEGNVSYKKEGTFDNADIINSPETYYGHWVTNYNSPNDAGILDTQEQFGKWQIFMADDTNIYLIASNYIIAEYTGKKNNVGYNYSQTNKTRIWFSNIVNQYNANTTKNDIPNILSNLDKQTTYHKWINTEVNQTKNLLTEKAVASMLDVSVWNGYNNSIYAKYAIGGPTIEMFCKSYNDSHTGNKLEAQELYDTGYKIKKGSTSATDTVSGLKTMAKNTLVDSMYFKESSDINCYYYWLASTSAAADYVMLIINGEGISYDGPWKDWSGLRPVVCLKSNVHLVEKTNGTTTTYELELD